MSDGAHPVPTRTQCHHETHRRSLRACPTPQEPFSRIRKDLLREVKALKPGDRCGAAVCV